MLFRAFAAGGGTDVPGRIVGRRLSEVLGRQVVISRRQSP
jgi:tripartite-type tricarboxylate transporter receptor subunit TctC